MNEYNLIYQDLEQIESLLKNNTNIDKLYTKLYTFELEGKKDTEEYKKHLEYLSMFLEFEEKIYKDANFSIKKALSWIVFLNQKSNNKIVARILYNLFSFITNNYNELLTLSNDEIQNITKLISITASGPNKETICKCIILKETIEKNLYLTFLNFLEENIEANTNKELRENLILGKYNTLFTNPKIEKIALSNNFNISTTPHIINEIPKQILPINIDLYKSIKDLISSTIANGEIHELLEIHDNEYTDISKVTIATFRQCMLRSSFQIMSDEKISDLNIDFHEYTETEEYQNTHQNDHISYNLIIHNFNKIKKDKTKRKILS